jgi:hypothetical protein
LLVLVATVVKFIWLLLLVLVVESGGGHEREIAMVMNQHAW